MSLSQAMLNDLYEYKDGELFYKKSPVWKIAVGSKAGSVNSQGYVKLSIDGKKHSAHRVIFMMNHGYLPEEVDHINGNRADNRIENLRASTKVENHYNEKIRSNNKSGVKGVSWHKASQKWQVIVTACKRKINMGLFKDFELAELVAHEARAKFHGKFANSGVTL